METSAVVDGCDGTGLSSSMIFVATVAGGVVSKLFAVCFWVKRNPCFCALRWPLWVARSDGGYRFTCLVVNSGKVVR